MSYKILSLDGGGSWALIQARVLKDLYGDIPGHELLKKFDMVIANSGGSLVLACLCNNMKPSDAILLFTNQNTRKKVFSALTFFEKLTSQNFVSLLKKLTNIGPEYKTSRKLTGLIEVLKQKQNVTTTRPIVETPMDELPAIIGKKELQLIIAGFDYFGQRVNFFRSNLNSLTTKFSRNIYSVTLGHAIHASSNAPLNYFDEPAEIKMHRTGDNRRNWYWDGAVSGFNNPVLAGLTEALTNNIKAEDCCILSIGTGTGSYTNMENASTSDNADVQKDYAINKDNPLVKEEVAFRFLSDIKKMSTSILQDPPDAATFIAYAMLDPSLSNRARLVRINPCLSPVQDKVSRRYEVPEVYRGNTEEFMALVEMDMDAVEDLQVEMISRLCDRFIVDHPGTSCVPNQYIRGDAAAPFCLGFGTYREAKKKWLEESI
ncbi:MAG: hypothetical protein JWN76_3804 [Chitinophagaceae bacterium]|nr:hypothetical protein [Chitinophagaceae bacterium]